MKISELLNTGIEQLKTNGMDSPILKAKLVLSNILSQNKEYLLINTNIEVDKISEKSFLEDIKKLLQNVPIQYIINYSEFMKLKFFVDENVLIPRNDTEILVEEVIEIAKDKVNLNILDLCTGSGAIAISIAHYIEKCKINGIDISKEAIKIAKFNSKLNNVEEKTNFFTSNLFENIKFSNYDFIVSNPPYIKTEDIKSLTKEVQNEPVIALDGGIDGLLFYKKIIDSAYDFLKKDGFLCFEIGYNQRLDVINLLNKAHKYKNIYSKKDLAGQDRIVIAQKQ